MIVVAAFAAFAYYVLMTSSKGFCAGGVAGDGRFIDSAGNVIASAPPCIQLTLRPSGVIFIAIVAIVIGALTLVLRRARSESDAIKYLNRATAAIGILVAASILISHVWFWTIPITEWSGSGVILFPFPFGSVDVVISTMSG